MQTMTPFSAIQSAAMQIAEQFKPQKIVLFGSYAYGKPNEDSDVDYMVLIRGRKVDDCALAIRAAIKFKFPVDLLVRSTVEFEKRIAMEDFFLREIKEKGVVLYEASNQRGGGKSRGRFCHRDPRITRKKISELR